MPCSLQAHACSLQAHLYTSKSASACLQSASACLQSASAVCLHRRRPAGRPAPAPPPPPPPPPHWVESRCEQRDEDGCGSGSDTVRRILSCACSTRLRSAPRGRPPLVLVRGGTPTDSSAHSSAAHPHTTLGARHPAALATWSLVDERLSQPRPDVRSWGCGRSAEGARGATTARNTLLSVF